MTRIESAPAMAGRSRALRAAGALTLGIVLAYAALLRFDAIAHKYDHVEQPGWIGALQDWRSGDSVLRPASIEWARVPLYPHADGPPTQYFSDPYTYLKYAREMRSFYAAHRREPLFPYVTRLYLAALAGHDTAVSAASATFSWLAVLGIFLLGRQAFSYGVGLAAAAAFAVEYDVISLAAEGWRDDAFTCAVVFFAWAAVRHAQSPTWRSAALLGVVSGVACLIRITSLSFLLPGLLALCVWPGIDTTRRLKLAALATCIAAALVAPFLVNCWRVFGDPLHAINVHADVYRVAEGQAVTQPQTAGQYIGEQLRTRPFRTADTAALGMTTYPFLNKWNGFEPWVSGSGRWLGWASLGGLILLAGRRDGLLILLVLATSLVPYAFTWRLAADWRFTAHAYPFFLLAAAYGGAQVVTIAWAAWQGRMQVPARTALRSAGVLAVVGLATWTIVRVLPVLVARETLGAGEPATFTAGARDAVFFGSSWDEATRSGNVTARVSRGPTAVVHLPLLGGWDYAALVRMDPFPPPRDPGGTMARVQVLLNKRLVHRFDLEWNPARIGVYEFGVPRDAVTDGWNQLTFVVSAAGVTAPRIRLWYVRLRPVGR